MRDSWPDTTPPRWSQGSHTLESWLAHLRAALDAAGLLDPTPIPEGPWRHAPATAIQLRHLRALGRRMGQGRLQAMGVPEAVRRRLRRAWREAPSLTRGAAQDFIEILTALAWLTWPPALNATFEGGQGEDGS
ncbi:MAG: hypothetical protein AAFX99_17385 [Myxococcota bacterium]